MELVQKLGAEAYQQAGPEMGGAESADETPDEASDEGEDVV